MHIHTYSHTQKYTYKNRISRNPKDLYGKYFIKFVHGIRKLIRRVLGRTILYESSEELKELGYEFVLRKLLTSIGWLLLKKP